MREKSACKQIVAATYGKVWKHTQPSQCRHNSQLNLAGTTSLHCNGPVVTMPSSDGFGSLRQHVCVYAAHTSTKPSDQVGAFSCYLTKLLPSVGIVLNFTCYHTHYTHCYKSDKVRRATKRVSELEKGFRGALPVTVRWEENQRLLRMGRLGHLVLANSGRLESHTAKNVRSNSVCCCNCCNHRVIIIIHRHNIASCWNIYTDILLLQWCKLM